MKFMLDTGNLGQLCHPKNAKNKAICEWFQVLLEKGETIVYLPELADYELRRKLLHLVPKDQADQKSIDRLNALASTLDYLRIDTAAMRKAAELWADARSKGHSTSDEKSLDGDVILAAQALSVEATVITTNRKHISRFFGVKDWFDLKS